LTAGATTVGNQSAAVGSSSPTAARPRPAPGRPGATAGKAPRSVNAALGPVWAGAAGRLTEAAGRPGSAVAHAIDAAQPDRPSLAQIDATGDLASFGAAPHLGAHTDGIRLLVGVAAAPGQGYWAVDSQGRVFAYGDASRLGSLPAGHKLGPAAAIVATPRGEGYWVLTRRGAVFPFGDAIFYGSPNEADLGSPVVAMAATPSGRGYWLVTQHGKVFAFGDAPRLAAGHEAPIADAVGIAATPDGRGYWVATEAGRVMAHGTARFLGSALGTGAPVTALAAAAGKRQGYWLTSADGRVRAFGSAAELGSALTLPGVQASAMAAERGRRGYVLASTDAPLPADKLIDVAPLRKAETQVLAMEGHPGGVVPSVMGMVHDLARATTWAMAPRTTTTTTDFLGNFMVTCYDNYGYTATGAVAGMESVAVDPGVIPLGTEIYVDGVGLRTADDTGGAVLGYHIDIWEPTFGQCADWGVRTRAVYRVGG
jgi:3D (Asp-Asp-Asp) domain-containing protein